MDKEAIVGVIPNCDVCSKPTLAYADAMIPLFNRWGYVCESHFKQHNCQLGLGKGQILIKEGK